MAHKMVSKSERKLDTKLDFEALQNTAHRFIEHINFCHVQTDRETDRQTDRQRKWRTSNFMLLELKAEGQLGSL